jgi:hypothetical protein
MANFSRMPRYDVRNDGIGPYAVFYCETCQREFRSQPDVAGNIAQDLGKEVAGGLLRKVPLFGSAVANSVMGEDARYSYKMTPQQVEKAWSQVQVNFRECPTCQRIVCVSDFDTRSGFCNEDSPRSNEINEAQGEQAGAAIKGFAAAFGLGDVMKNMEQAAKTAQNAAAQTARCPKDGTMAAPGTKFCPECGTPMVQPKVDACSKCGQPTYGAKFCPACGTKQEPAAGPGVCPNCGTPAAPGAKFCAGCGTKIG